MGADRGYLAAAAKEVVALVAGVPAGQGIQYSDTYPLRWQPVLDSICRPTYPTSATDATIVSWIYWGAFGKAADRLNGNSWTDSTLASLRGRGIVRSATTWKKEVGLLGPWVPDQLLDLNAAKLGGGCRRFRGRLPGRGRRQQEEQHWGAASEEQLRGNRARAATAPAMRLAPSPLIPAPDPPPQVQTWSSMPLTSPRSSNTSPCLWGTSR